jgi:hypothetical protein
MTQLLLRTLPVIAFVGVASCSPFSHEPPGGDYVKFAALAPGYPAFAPGLGTVYVEPRTRPVGPYRSYDHNGKLIATIYMVPEKDLDEHLKIVSDEKTPPEAYAAGYEPVGAWLTGLISARWRRPSLQRWGIGCPRRCRRSAPGASIVVPARPTTCASALPDHHPSRPSPDAY